MARSPRSSPCSHQRTSTRASFLRNAGTAAALAVAGGLPLLGADRDHPILRTTPASRILWIKNALTGEDIAAPFTLDGETVYAPGYYAICRLLRDTHVSLATGYVAIDIRAIEALYEVQQVLTIVGVHEPIVVHSGFRTAATNERVGGAARSYHMRAEAVDFSVPGVSFRYIWDVCKSRPIAGGIGYYPDSHIHVDCGPRRYWTD